MEHRYYNRAEPKRRGRGDQAGGARWWKTAPWQRQQTKKKSKVKQRKQKNEGCKAVPSCHIRGVDAGKPNPSQYDQKSQI